jgi:transcriptional regulator with XRE-family HTH domain
VVWVASLPIVKIAQDKPVVKPSQVRMARAALRWSLEELARRAGVHRNTVYNFETEKFAGDQQSIAAIRQALQEAGVEFIEDDGGGPGVRLKRE